MEWVGRHARPCCVNRRCRDRSNLGVQDPAGEPGLSNFDIQRLDADGPKQAAVENSPLATVPDTTDCVSCDVAGHASFGLAQISERTANETTTVLRAFAASAE
jgi:hypothetical protein